jgi:hypothetical protein
MIAGEQVASERDISSRHWAGERFEKCISKGVECLTRWWRPWHTASAKVE